MHNTIIKVGDFMAKETINAVRQAEIKAVEIENAAIAKKEEILRNAHLQAKNIVNEAVMKAQEAARSERCDAEQRAEQIVKAAKEKAENDVNILKTISKEKAAVVIDKILESVVMS